jgi:formylglycine-generating enzyme required for sulfatase activity
MQRSKSHGIKRNWCPRLLRSANNIVSLLQGLLVGVAIIFSLPGCAGNNIFAWGSNVTTGPVTQEIKISPTFSIQVDATVVAALGEDVVRAAIDEAITYFTGLPASPGKEARKEAIDKGISKALEEVTKKGKELASDIKQKLENIIGKAIDAKSTQANGDGGKTAIHDGMVPVPAGDFRMGSSKDEIKKVYEEFRTKYPRTQLWWFEDELPRHTENIGMFWIDKYEVTNAQFEKFLNSPDGAEINPPRLWESRSSPTGKHNHPVTSVDRFQAIAYCKFLGKRLATETEWEKAARGPQGNIYPWTNQPSMNDVNSAESERHSTTEVGTMKGDVSVYGVHDMGGNAMELVVGDKWPHHGYDAYAGFNGDSTEANDAFEKRRGWTITRGGSYDSLIFDSRGANRRYFSPNHRGSDIGFRCTSN